MEELVPKILTLWPDLDYTIVPVPETIGLPTFVFAILGVLFLHRRMRLPESNATSGLRV